jgi:hypothetical protein
VCSPRLGGVMKTQQVLLEFVCVGAFIVVGLGCLSVYG